MPSRPCFPGSHLSVISAPGIGQNLSGYEDNVVGSLVVMYTLHILCNFYRTNNPNTVPTIITTSSKQDNQIQIHTTEQRQ